MKRLSAVTCDSRSTNIHGGYPAARRINLRGSRRIVKPTPACHSCAQLTSPRVETRMRYVPIIASSITLLEIDLLSSSLSGTKRGHVAEHD